MSFPPLNDLAANQVDTALSAGLAENIRAQIEPGDLPAGGFFDRSHMLRRQRQVSVQPIPHMRLLDADRVREGGLPASDFHSPSKVSLAHP